MAWHINHYIGRSVKEFDLDPNLLPPEVRQRLLENAQKDVYNGYNLAVVGPYSFTSVDEKLEFVQAQHDCVKRALIKNPTKIERTFTFIS